MPSPTRSRARQQGFTLVEIMVVVVIIGLLATLVVPNVLQMGEEAKIKKAQADVTAIANAIKTGMTLGTIRELPTMEQLVTPNEKGIALIETARNDPWDNEYEIRPGETRLRFEVISAGPNGTMGDEDDISSLNIGVKK